MLLSCHVAENPADNKRSVATGALSNNINQQRAGVLLAEGTMDTATMGLSSCSAVLKAVAQSTMSLAQRAQAQMQLT